MKLTKIMYGALLSLGLFAACGDDSSSGSDGNSETVSISVDETTQTIALFLKESEDLCVRTETETGYSYQWENVVTKDDTLSWQYSFMGDTLIITQNSSDYGIVLVGGSASSIYGTWTELDSCEYDDGIISCDIDDASSYIRKYSISRSSITATRTLKNNVIDEDDYDYYDDVAFDDYMNSAFINRLLYGIDEGGFSRELSAYQLVNEDSLDVMSYSTQYPVSSKSKNSMTFAVDGKDVTVKADVNYDIEEEYAKASVTVSYNGSTCSYDYESVEEMTSSYCKAENEEYLDFDYDYDAQDNKFYYAEEYEKENSVEFNACLNTAFFGTVSEDALYKKAATSTVAIKKLRKVQRDFYKAVKNLKK